MKRGAGSKHSPQFFMTTFYMIRHGQSLANKMEIFTGQTDIALSPLGLEQAACTAAYILSHYQVDAVYASDLKRAFETARAVADPLHLTVQPHSGLREIYAGEWERAAFTTLNQDMSEPWRIWREDIGNAVCPGGESVAQLQARVIDTLREIARENEGRAVVIGTHATPIRALECHCRGLSLAEMKDIPWVANASITTVLCDNGNLTLKEVGFADHLSGLRTALPSGV